MPCPFCDLLRSGEARWVAQERDTVAFLPLKGEELAPGHTLVIPREHTGGIFDVNPHHLRATVELMQRVSRSMRVSLGATGVVILNASGHDAGGSVEHLHFHVVPCWEDDETTFWPSTRSAHVLDSGVDPAELLRERLDAPPI